MTRGHEQRLREAVMAYPRMKEEVEGYFGAFGPGVSHLTGQPRAAGRRGDPTGEAVMKRACPLHRMEEKRRWVEAIDRTRALVTLALGTDPDTLALTLPERTRLDGIILRLLALERGGGAEQGGNTGEGELF